MTSLRKAHLSMVAVTLIFGLHYTIAKSLMPAYLHPMQLIFIRLLGGVLFFWIFQRFYQSEKVARKDLMKLALAGLIGFTLNQSLFYTGLNLTSPVDASIIHVSNPILVLILASIFIREKITVRKTAGIVLGATGSLILILYGKELRFGSDSTWGNLLILLNILCYSVYLILIKSIVGKYNNTTILKWVSLFGFMFIVPFSGKSAFSIQFDHLDAYAWIALGFVVIFSTFFVYLLLNYSLKRMTPSMVSYYTYLQPVIATVSAVSLGTGTITIQKILAALFIFTGVYLVNSKKATNIPLQKMSKRE